MEVFRGVFKHGFEYTHDWTWREVDPQFYDFDANNIKTVMKANCVRVSFNNWFYANDSTYKANVIAWVKANTSRGTRIIMDLQSYYNPMRVGMTQGSEQVTDPALAWNFYNVEVLPTLMQVAGDFIDEPLVIGVEVNEFWPMYQDDSANWIFDLQMTEDLAKKIHAINPALYIFADMYPQWASDAVIRAGVSILTEPRIVFCPHFFIWNQDMVSSGKYGADDGSDMYSTYNSGDYANGKLKLIKWFGLYWKWIVDLYNLPVVVTEFATDSKAGSLQGLNDLLDYFVAHNWGFIYMGYYGQDTPSIHLLKGDWTGLQPQGVIFVSRMEVLPTPTSPLRLLLPLIPGLVLIGLSGRMSKRRG